MTSFFIGGIIQGSINDVAIHPQDYRTRIKDLLLRWVPGADVYCPIENHPDSLRYEDTHARSVFFGHVDRCGETDVLVAYLPEASMGTAVEMYEAQRKGHIVLTISPMSANWVVKFLSTRVFADLDEFERFVESGELVELLAERPEASP